MKKIVISYVLFCFSIHAWDPLSSAVNNVTEAINKRFDDRWWSYQLGVPSMNLHYIDDLLLYIPHEDKYKDIRDKIENNELNSYEALEQLKRNVNNARELIISDIKDVNFQIENPSLIEIVMQSVGLSSSKQSKICYLNDLHEDLIKLEHCLSSPNSILYKVNQYFQVKKDALTLQPIDKFRILMNWNDNNIEFSSRVVKVAEKRQQKNKSKFETISKTSSFMVSDDDLFIIFGI